MKDQNKYRIERGERERERERERGNQIIVKEKKK